MMSEREDGIEAIGARGSASRAAAPATGVTLYRPIIVGALYLLTLFTGFSVLVGLILAYVWRGEEETAGWENTHFTYLIRTFWIGFWVAILMAVAMIGTTLALSTSSALASLAMVEDREDPAIAVLVFGGLALWLMMCVWFFVRTIRSLANAASQKAMPNPKTWLF